MTAPETVPEHDAAAEARELMRRGLKAALASSDMRTGAPYASLVTVATEPDGAPLFLISTLARHTRNLAKDDRACLLFDGTDGHGDPLEGAHLVGGFGRIHDLGRDALLTDIGDATALIDAEPDIVQHMNEDHADAVALYATRLLGGSDGDWRFTGCDPEGCDLVLDDAALRLAFPARVNSPGDVRKALVELADAARTASG